MRTHGHLPCGLLLANLLAATGCLYGGDAGPDEPPTLTAGSPGLDGLPFAFSAGPDDDDAVDCTSEAIACDCADLTGLDREQCVTSWEDAAIDGWTSDQCRDLLDGLGCADEAGSESDASTASDGDDAGP